MGTWNHRVIAFVDTDGSPYFSVHEVHYEYGKPVAYTESPAEPLSRSMGGLRWQLEHMLKCLDQPPLKESDFAEPSGDQHS